MENKASLKEIAQVFCKLGCIGFGGPAAHIAMMQKEVVTHKKWLTQQHFLDLVGATNLIPGPNSTEMAIHIGYEKKGWKGLLVAGLGFILPAVAITGCLAWLYKQYGQLPQMQPFIYGIKPAIIAIILGAIKPLAQKSFKNATLWVMGILVAIGALLNISEILLLFTAGFGAMILHYFKSKQELHSVLPLGIVPWLTTIGITSGQAHLFWIFLKVGSILYGSGYVLFAFLDTELVATGLLTRQQLLDAIAVGQFTPGPVFSSVTFIGYQIEGFQGAVIATFAIFIPSFVFVALLSPLVKKMRNSKNLAAFLDAVNGASVAIIVAVCIQMGQETLTDWKTVTIALISLYVAFRHPKINSAFLVLGGSLLGYALSIR